MLGGCKVIVTEGEYKGYKGWVQTISCENGFIAYGVIIDFGYNYEREITLCRSQFKPDESYVLEAIKMLESEIKHLTKKKDDYYKLLNNQLKV